MLGIVKNKSEESEKIRVSIDEINTQLQKCGQIEAVEVDLEKYDNMLENIRGCVEGRPLKDEPGESVDLVQTKEVLLLKEQVLEEAKKQLIDFETEYNEFIKNQKERLQDPEAELSRIKVQVRRKKEEMKAFSLSKDVDQIPELIRNAETILRNVNMRKEMGISFQAVRLLPVEEIERTRKVLEEDEKKLYEVRKSIHASKEILSFMEFRFSEIEQMISKGGFKEVKGEWKELQQRKSACEQYVNGQQTIVRRAVERLFEVRQELQVIEHPEAAEREDVSIEQELQNLIEHMKAKIEEFKGNLARFDQWKDALNQEFATIEMTLEDLWRNL